MRRNFIVTYDICDPKRLRKVFKLCKGYGIHLQYSVFECDLNDRELVQMKADLGDLIHHREDQVLFIDLGPVAHRSERTISAIGEAYIRIDPPCYVV